MKAARVSPYHLSASGLKVVQARAREIRAELRLNRSKRELAQMLRSTKERSGSGA